MQRLQTETAPAHAYVQQIGDVALHSAALPKDDDMGVPHSKDSGKMVFVDVLMYRAFDPIWYSYENSTRAIATSLTSPGLHLSRKPPIRFLNCREVVQEVYVCQPYLSSFNYQHQPNNSSTATLNPLSTNCVLITALLNPNV